MSAKKPSKPNLPKIPQLPDETDIMDLSQNTLLSTLLNDPASRAMVLQFMAHAQKDIKYKEDQMRKVENKLKQNRFVFESPTAQFRRKELARRGSANSPANSDSGSSSSCSTNDKVARDAELTERVPFNKLLHGLVIYVEVFSNGQDKSISAKALVQSMGAKVSDKISRGITHVIFKDGSYRTYQLAKRLKLHVVSILWLQAVKRKGTIVPEKDYPAFGADHCDLNVSTICKNLQSEFDDVCQDEYSKINTSKLISIPNKTAIPTSKHKPLIRSSSLSIRKSLSDSDDDSVFLSAKSTKTSASTTIQGSTKLASEFSSDADGETCKNLNDSLELTTNLEPATSNRSTRKTLYNPEHDTMLDINTSKNKRKTMFAIPVLKESNRDSNLSNKSLSRDSMDLTCLDNSSNTTLLRKNNITDENVVSSSTRRSKGSLESNSSVNSSNRSSINSNSLDLISFAGSRRRSVRIASKSEEVFKKPIEPSKETSFSEKLSSLRLSSDSNKRQSIDTSDNRLSIDNNSILQTPLLSQQSNNIELMEEVPQHQLQIDTDSSAKEMSGLQLSESVVSTPQENPKKRQSDETSDDSSPPKKSRQEPKSSVSEQSSSDGSGKKKSRKLYDIDDPVNNDDLVLQIEPGNVEKPKESLAKGRVKRAMELVTKPFKLTPDVIKDRAKSSSNDSDNGTNNNTVLKKRFTKVKVRATKEINETNNKADVSTTSSIGIAKSPPKTFATPKTPRKPQAKGPSTPSRKSSRFATPINYKRFYDDKISSLDESTDSNASVITPKLNRRSTMDFSTSMNVTPKCRTQKETSGVKRGSAKSGIACTRFKVGRVNTFSHIVRRLGRFHIDSNVTGRTTHLVVGENKRTVNLLRAIARGCWILSADWLYKSMAAGKWLPEDDYEFTDFSEAVQICRKERQAFGPTYTADTFGSCGPIYVASRGTKPAGEELRELVRLGGGTVAQVARAATIVVGEVVRYDMVQWCVSELWVLDSLSKNDLMEFGRYSLVVEEEVGGIKRRERRLSEDY